MSEGSSSHGVPAPHPAHSPHDHNALRPGNRSGSITLAGGALGIAASFIGFAIFLSGCAGFDAAFKFALIPLILAVPGLILTIVGGAMGRTHGMEDTHVVASLFLNAACLMGGLVLVAIWRGTPIFAGGGI